MATREFRLAEFNQGSPPAGQQLLLLCEDHNGTYTLPFRCEWRDGAWYAVEKTKLLEIKVVGDRGGIELARAISRTRSLPAAASSRSTSLRRCRCSIDRALRLRPFVPGPKSLHSETTWQDPALTQPSTILVRLRRMISGLSERSSITAGSHPGRIKP
jgi:hypothetical protein